VDKSKKDIVAQSRAYWELGRLYQTHNKLVNAMSEFQRALQLLEDERATSGSVPGAPTHQHYELELLFQLGLTAKEMADIFQQADYLEKALAIAQTDRKFLSQYTQISMELGRAHLVSENPQVALRSFEAHLRSLIFGQHSPSQPVHTALEISRIDWRLVAAGCYQTGATLRALAQEKEASAQDTLEYGELAREFLVKAEGVAEALGDKETKAQARSLLDRSSLPTGGRRISEPPSNALVKDKVDASPKKSEPQEDTDEDWDAELGIEAEEDRPALAHLLVSTSKAKVERVPLKHRLFEAVSNQTFEIVKFPKPTFLYTLMTSSGHSFMHEEELESWLKNVLARHTKGETANIAQHARDRLPFPELLSYYSTKIAKVSKGTKEWSILCVEFCYIIYLHGHLEFCLHSIHGFFDDLRNTVGTSKGHHPVPDTERDVLFDHSFHLLYLASKLWKPEEDETFQRMMKVQRQLSAQHAYLVDVLAAETYSHHLYHHTTSSHEEDDDDDDDVDEDEGELSDGPDSTPSWNTHKPSANGAEHESFEEARANPLLALCKTYTKCKHIRTSHSAKPDEKQRAQIACARALVSIHLHMHGISPLTTARLSSKENLHAVLAKAISEGDKEYAEALQPSSRMRIVEELYPALPVGLLKAKAAFALAHHHKEFLGKPAQAERMYFEAIYILDQCKVFPIGLPPILSELGKNALLGYADVLITNYKYQYGILCYEAALENLYLRGKMSAREYPSLLRRVAAISRDNHDMRRAVVLYKDILHSYCAENKINEVIFVSETLASIHLERGDFALAESYLLAASLALRRNSPQTDRMDPMYFDLQLKQMAPLYLDSFHFERGIELLDRLSIGELSHDKRNRLLADLAGAYIKKEWFDECTQILSRLEVEVRKRKKNKYKRNITFYSLEFYFL
jgi:tetratricopeptide (TPR) repeat protein